jgi:hypothetical protein
VGVQTAKPLYNGNIASMLVNIPALGTADLYGYRYDQLNRLTAMDKFDGLNNATNVLTAVARADYKEKISYDANGNILTYLRRGTTAASGLLMDSMAYQYPRSSGLLLNSREHSQWPHQSIFPKLTIPACR